MAHATTKVVHEFRSGPFVATVEEGSAGDGKKYRFVVRDADQRGDKPLAVVSGKDLHHLGGLCAAAEKLIEYLSHGFPYDAWREDYDPTYSPDASDS